MSSMMGSSAPLIAFFALVMGVAYYGILIYVVWKFYQMLSKINDNVVAIGGMRGMPSAVAPAAAGPATQTKIQVCGNCGLRVMPTVEGLCPSCHGQIS